jgi:hypothetical protein
VKALTKHNEDSMIIKCDCGADSCGRWKQLPAVIFHDRYAKGAGASERGFVYSCRACLSPKREEEIQLGSGRSAGRKADCDENKIPIAPFRLLARWRGFNGESAG